MGVEEKYEMVIGLEVHAQLLTKSKLFCGDSVQYGAEPNTQVSPITLAHPGTLPKMNRKAIELALRLGVALECNIVQNNYFARKNYFYPDLPKGYQISQHTTPICKNGFVTIFSGTEKKIALNRIHLEEDAGKSIHDADPDFTSIDLNRAGVPLLEIVTEPVMHSPEEAFQFVTELRRMVRYLGICDGNMEEGSLRCDANISIREKGDTRLGTKVEVKNLNSIKHVRKAIEIEVSRMIGLVENGEQICQETRSLNVQNMTTFSLRTKEEADDYRYFPEPDLTPFHIADAILDEVRTSMPALPAQLQKRYVEQLHLSLYDAKVLCEDKETSDYFEAVIQKCTNYKAAANWILGPVRSAQNENNSDISALLISPSALAELVAMVETGKISFSTASSKIFPAMLKEPAKPALDIAVEMNLLQVSNDEDLGILVDTVISSMPDKVNEFRKGKKGLLSLFAGEVKKLSKGKADMQVVTKLLNEKLNQ